MDKSIERMRNAKCCVCQGSMQLGHINVIILDRKASWEYPTAGNVLTGEMGQATSIICDDCLEKEKPIKFALKSTGDGYVYVPVDKLPFSPNLAKKG